MKKQYTKPNTSYAEQIDLLLSRGLIISDRQYAEDILKSVRYYRLSGFSLPFEHTRHQFKSKVRIEDIVELIAFDKGLRNLLWDHIEHIESYIKSVMSYYLAQRYGIFCHESISIFADSSKHKIWIDGVHREIDRSKERFIKHFANCYEEFPKVPLWVAIEVMTMGTVSTLYSSIRKSDQLEIAREVGIHSSLLPNWLHVLTYIRNICAHHGRIWNRELAIKPILPKSLARDILTNDKTASILYLVKALMNGIPTREKELVTYKEKIVKLVHDVERLNVSRSLDRMGIVDRSKFLDLFCQSKE